MKKRLKAFGERGSPKIKVTQPQPQSGNGTSQSPPPAYTEIADEDVYGEAQRTQDRHKDASEQLRAALKAAEGTWKAFQGSEDTVPENVNPAQIRQAISEFFASQEKAVKDKSRWAKCKKVIEKVYTTISPFLKNVLVIVTQGSGVIYQGSS
jgi:hypothetical protein